MIRVHLIALGSRTACDDEAAMLAAAHLHEQAEVVLAGRPGPGLVDLLDPGRPTVLCDVVDAALAAGRVISLPLRELVDASVTGPTLSSHGLGPAEALRLAVALRRPLPTGTFVGIQGRHFRPGAGLSSAVERALPSLVHALRVAVADHLRENVSR